MRYKHVEMAFLFDFYGELLTEKQRDIFDLYYNEDLSLSEIAEIEEITRQGVRDAIMRSEEVLRDIEKRLGLVARFDKMRDTLKSITADTQSIININRGQYDNAQINMLAERILSGAAALGE